MRYIKVDESVFGKDRLFSTDTWGTEITNNELQRKAEQVMDEFHKKIKDEEYPFVIRWVPRRGELELSSVLGEDLTKFGSTDIAKLKTFLDDSYTEVA